MSEKATLAYNIKSSSYRVCYIIVFNDFIQVLSKYIYLCAILINGLSE